MLHLSILCHSGHFTASNQMHYCFPRSFYSIGACFKVLQDFIIYVKCCSIPALLFSFPIRWTQPVKLKSWTSTWPQRRTRPAGEQQSFRFSSPDTGKYSMKTVLFTASKFVRRKFGHQDVFLCNSYNPYDGPNDNPEVELPLTAGEYIYVYGDMDDDGFYEGNIISYD